jgi:hypothetical protein
MDVWLGTLNSVLFKGQLYWPPLKIYLTLPQSRSMLSKHYDLYTFSLRRASLSDHHYSGVILAFLGNAPKLTVYWTKWGVLSIVTSTLCSIVYKKRVRGSFQIRDVEEVEKEWAYRQTNPVSTIEYNEVFVQLCCSFCFVLSLSLSFF